MRGYNPRLLVDWDAEGTRLQRRDSVLAAAVAQLSLLLVTVLAPRVMPGFNAAAQEPAVMVMQPPHMIAVPLYLPGDLLAQFPDVESNTPPDLTPEERLRAVLRGPDDAQFDPNRLQLNLPRGARQPGEGGEEGDESTGESERAAREPEGPGDQARTAEKPETSETGTAQLEDLLERPEGESSGNPELALSRPGQTIEESLRRSAEQAGRPGGAAGDPAGTLEPNLKTPFPVILSDTRGVDFSPYLIRLLRDVRLNWYAVMPESVRLGEQGRAVLIFTIMRDGSVPAGEPRLVLSSGRSHLDRAALGAIGAAQPFPALPSEFDGPNIVLQFTFLYNLPYDYAGP